MAAIATIAKDQLPYSRFNWITAAFIKRKAQTQPIPKIVHMRDFSIKGPF